MPFFSVIIPAYNRAAMLERALSSVFSQDFSDYELIVVDDGSTDGTPEMLTMYRDDITIIRQQNRGVSAARNAGLRHARAPWILFLDSDDEYLPGKFSAHREFINKNPSILLHQTEELWIRRGRRVNPMKKHQKLAGNIFIPSLKLCLISPSCACVHRDLFDQYGMFDELLPACEDYDLWLRMSLREKVGLIPEAFTVKYGGHSDQLSRRHWGMDRFRVYAICKILSRHGDTVPLANRMAAIGIAREKCQILIAGAKKRNKKDFAAKLEELIEWLDFDSRSNIDFSFLLQE